jgi:hypothetical protein
MFVEVCEARTADDNALLVGHVVHEQEHCVCVRAVA